MADKATREGYGDGLCALAEIRPDLIVLDADLSAATKTSIFRKAYPDKHYNCGIAEQNMMGVAAGIASTGKLVFASSFAMFAAGRAFEIIRNSIAYPNLNVKIGATHAGISVGEDGATHQCNEDIALMRAIPNMTIINPADYTEAKAAVLAMAEYKGPTYLRFGRLAVPIFNDEAAYKFEVGKGITVKDGNDITVIATGLMVAEAMEAGKILAEQGIDARIINMHTIKPIDREIIVKAACETGKIITGEEHSVIGGLGSAVCDVVLEEHPSQVIKIGIPDSFGHSGAAKDLLKEYGLTADNIVKTVKQVLGK